MQVPLETCLKLSFSSFRRCGLAASGYKVSCVFSHLQARRAFCLLRSAAALAVTMQLGCTAAQAPVPAPVQLRMVGTEPAASLVAAFERRVPGVRVSLTQTASPIAGVRAIARGDTDIGVVFADAAYTAHVVDGAGSPLRAMGSLNVAPLFLLVHPESGIRHLADLPGHTVRLTSPNPGDDPRFRLPFRTADPGHTQTDGDAVSSLSELVIGAFGLRPSRLQIRDMAPPEGLAALRAGSLQAYFTSAPSDDLVREATGWGARLVPIEGPQVDSLRLRYPFVQHVRIPPGTYPGQDSTLHTVGVGLVLVCRADLDPALTYRLTRAFIQELEQLSGRDPILSRIRLERTPVTPIPLHAGAARFYREWELFR